MSRKLVEPTVIFNAVTTTQARTIHFDRGVKAIQILFTNTTATVTVDWSVDGVNFSNSTSYTADTIITGGDAPYVGIAVPTIGTDTVTVKVWH